MEKFPKLWFGYWEWCQWEASLYKSNKCISTFCFVPASLFTCLIFVFVSLQKFSAMVFLCLMCLPDACCTSPAAFVLLWRVISPCKQKLVTILVLKTAWSSTCSNSFPWPQPSFQRRSLPANSGAFLFHAKESYLFSQAYLLYLEKGCWRLLEQERLLPTVGGIPRLLVAGAAWGCQGALPKW